MTTDRTLTIDIWSDIVCPFCYLGDTALEQALEGFAHRDAVKIRYRSFELMPDIGNEPIDLQEHLTSKYSPEQIKMQHEHLATRGAELGIEYNFGRAITVNTRTAHRLLQFAAQHGRGQELTRILFKAYFTDGQHIGDVETLVRLAEASGLDSSAAREVLESDRFADDVDEDIEQARRLGIQGVPFFVLNNTYGVSGAQPVEVFTRALETAWADGNQ